ncbi:MAG TPA: hypothetical protein VJS68_01875 [Thermoplasmata archaeon]|nr:hypothetical protein [Thermoplasmata archaeon]
MLRWHNTAQRRFAWVMRAALLWKVAALGVLLYLVLRVGGL